MSAGSASAVSSPPYIWLRYIWLRYIWLAS
jgi:hypothetical protein